MTDHDKTLRDEFEAHAISRQLALSHRYGGYVYADTIEAFHAWKAAHAKYAPRWLPIDEAAKDGRLVLGFNSTSKSSCIAHWNGSTFYDVWTRSSFILTHYMPIPDAPEVAT